MTHHHHDQKEDRPAGGGEPCDEVEHPRLGLDGVWVERPGGVACVVEVHREEPRHQHHEGQGSEQRKEDEVEQRQQVTLLVLWVSVSARNWGQRCFQAEYFLLDGLLRAQISALEHVMKEVYFGRGMLSRAAVGS